MTQNGRMKKVTARKAVLLKELDRALKGDGRAADRLLSRAERMSGPEAPKAGALAEDDNDILESYLAELRDRKKPK